MRVRLAEGNVSSDARSAGRAESRYSSHPDILVRSVRTMADLRNLLLDCRSALRRANRQFDEDPLRAKLDEALNELGKKAVEDVLEQPETRTAQQVAYAWQIATRSVKL